MSFFGRSQPPDQCCSTTLTWQKGAYMSNAWREQKQTCATMSWTGMWWRGTSVKRLPITGKQRHAPPLLCPRVNDDFDWTCCPELCQVFQSVTTAVSPVSTPVRQNKPQLVATQCQHFNLHRVRIKRGHLQGGFGKSPRVILSIIQKPASIWIFPYSLIRA